MPRSTLDSRVRGSDANVLRLGLVFSPRISRVWRSHRTRPATPCGSQLGPARSRASAGGIRRHPRRTAHCPWRGCSRGGRCADGTRRCASYERRRCAPGVPSRTLRRTSTAEGAVRPRCVQTHYGAVTMRDERRRGKLACAGSSRMDWQRRQGQEPQPRKACERGSAGVWSRGASPHHAVRRAEPLRHPLRADLGVDP
jgi:hypothetical protein